MRWRGWVPCLAALLAAGVVVVLVLPGEEARAGAASEFAKSENADLVKYIQGGAATNLRMVALEVLRKKAGSTADLVALAGGKNLVAAVYATGALGKQKTTASKAALKDLVTDTKLGVEVRKAAMSALAVHWKDTEDLAWLEEKTGSDAALKGHCTWVKTCVYGR